MPAKGHQEPAPAVLPMLRIHRARRGPKSPQSEKPAAPAAGVRVKCLGPAEGEHWFRSMNPAGNRICSRCRAMQLGLRLSPREEPVCVRAPGGVSLPPE